MSTGLARRESSGRVAAGMAWLLLRRALAALLTWQERSRERRHLAALDDRLLRDLGLTRSMVCEESEKPFWRS